MQKRAQIKVISSYISHNFANALFVVWRAILWRFILQEVVLLQEWKSELQNEEMWKKRNVRKR